MILITGGLGYIGVHACIDLLKSNHKIIIIDNLENTSVKALKCIKDVTNKEPIFVRGDIRNRSFLRKIFKEHEIQSVMHFAGLKSVSLSNKDPLSYYEYNISGSINLFSIMNEFDVKNLIFSSSATVYNPSKESPYSENSLVGGCTNVYGQTKLYIENFIKKIYKSDENWSIGILRYFNPIGYHSSGKVYDFSSGIPENLLPYILRVAQKKSSHLNVFGDDYLTNDGTGVRDYVHVEDLASGHKLANLFIENSKKLKVWNLGSGRGHSVLEIIKIFESETNIKIPYKILPRRDGDVAKSVADISKAKEELGWSPETSLRESIATLNKLIKDSHE